MRNSPLKNNIDVLDSLRAFAALSVCLFHFICTTTGFIETEWILNTFSVGKFGVQLFFVISGFVIPWSMYHAGYKFKNVFAFFLKRIARLEPPYLFSIFLALVILYLRENFLGKENDHMIVTLKQIVLHFGYLIPFFEGYKWLNQVYWTLAIEFQYYIFMALTFIPLTHSALPKRILIYAFMLLLSIYNDSEFLPHWLPLFLLGILLFMFKVSLISGVEYYLVTGIVLIYGLFLYPVWAIVYSVIPLALILYYPDLKIKLFNYIGKFSYSLYLIHPLIGASVINLLSHHSSSPWMKFLFVSVGLCITFLGAWLTYLFIEKPSKKLSSSVKYR